jgi:hypothetical protein
MEDVRRSAFTVRRTEINRGISSSSAAEQPALEWRLMTPPEIGKALKAMKMLVLDCEGVLKKAEQRDELVLGLGNQRHQRIRIFWQQG